MSAKRPRLSRRELGKMALAAAAALDAQAADGKYTGALDGLEDKVDIAAFDPVYYTWQLHDAAPLRLTFRADNLEAAREWQKTLRAKVAELLGGYPEERAPLAAQYA